MNNEQRALCVTPNGASPPRLRNWGEKNECVISVRPSSILTRQMERRVMRLFLYRAQVISLAKLLSKRRSAGKKKRCCTWPGHVRLHISGGIIPDSDGSVCWC